MKRILTLICGLTVSASAFSQDTTWVQTYTFDTIETRRADFQFPASLDDKRFEKVLMYYKLKCSPLTTWDQYSCGEWDYLTYTRVFDHTGVLDSVRRDGMRYRLNTLSPASAAFRDQPFFDKRWKAVQNTSPDVIANHTVAGAPAAAVVMLSAQSNGSTIQWIITGAELASAGATAGNIQGLQLTFVDPVALMEGVQVKMKHTSAVALTAWETSGFTTVFENQLSGIASGTNSIYFPAPFNWDGTSNVIVEIAVSDANPAAGMISLEGQAAAEGSVSMYANSNGVFNPGAASHAELNMSNADLGGDFTIAFWTKGNSPFGTGTSLLEAVDSVGNRILNIHFPWSDNNIYFDAGNQNGYDRIQKIVVAADVMSWHHWTFVKKASTGQMFIYKDGVLFHSGTNLNRTVGKIDRIFLGSGWNQEQHYNGSIDEFSVWTEAMDAATIAGWMNLKVVSSHPNYGALEMYYDFDDQLGLVDKSVNNRLGMPSATGMVARSAYPVAGRIANNVRPAAAVIQGTMIPGTTDSILTTVFPQPKVLFEYTAGDNTFNVINNSLVYPEATIDTLNVAGAVIGSGPSGADQTITNSEITYYEEPFEVIHDVEIGRYITPYGIQFDLGPQGFTWIYDVTDYQKYLHGMVDLAAHNTQELIDLKFAFIEGTPPRDVHNVEPVWENFRSYNYGNLSNDTELAPQTIALSDTSAMFKIKTRFTGHGQVGNAACCEWVPNDHKISINGVERFTWNIWQESECGENPNISQGGTWPYAREGWCPGDAVKEHDHEITPYVTPGQEIVVDYGITEVASNDPGQAGGNYIAALDLVSYSAPNFQHDAAIHDILNPNNYEYYRKFNPSCSNPQIVLQNTGEQPLTNCTIRCWITSETYQDYQWTGNLAFLEKEVVEIPITSDHFWYNNVNSEFHAKIMSVGTGANQDEYANNNELKTKFEAVEFVEGPFFVYFKTNNKAAENRWKLIDSDNNVIFERTSLTNTTIYQDTFNLDAGCYSIILEDSDHDGIGFWYSSQVEGETTGQFRLRKVGGGYFETFPADFGKYHRYNFSVGFTLGLDDNGKEDENLFIFPNPAAETVRAEFNGNIGNDITVQVRDVNGRTLKSYSIEQNNGFSGIDIPVSDLTAGMYFISFSGKEGIRTAQFIKQ